jgi:phytoene dehydrogenase-like protein
VTHGELVAAARAHIERAGGRVLAGGELARIEVEGQRVVRLHQSDGQEVPVDEAILSLGPPRLIEAGAGLSQIDGRFSQLASLEPVPRLDVHMTVQRTSEAPILPGPHVLPMESAVALVLRRGVAGEGSSAREHWQAVIPSAGDWIDREEAQIASDVEAELRRLLPEQRWGPVTERRVDKRSALGYTQPPAIGPTRPATNGAIENLYFAGSWCDTGWPATLEGAAAAGTRAANHVLASLGREAPADDAPARPAPSLLYRLLSG